jgi:hypothetical protein
VSGTAKTAHKAMHVSFVQYYNDWNVNLVNNFTYTWNCQSRTCALLLNFFWSILLLLSGYPLKRFKWFFKNNKTQLLVCHVLINNLNLHESICGMW